MRTPERLRARRPLRLALLSVGAFALPQTAWAHAGSSAKSHALWQQWGASPVELLLLLLPAFWYFVGLRALWARAGVGRGASRSHAAAFGTGMLTLVIALASPLDAVSEALFSAHMVQHLLLILVAAPLLVRGAPVLPLVWALPRGQRRQLGLWWHRAVLLRNVAHALTTPASAFVLHFVALWFWHMPVPYQAALQSPALHALEHLSFLGTAVLFWWTVATPIGRPRAREGMDVLMVGGTLMHSGALGALLMFSRTPWYPAHGATALGYGMTALEDQQLAGLIMWIPASVIYLAAAAWMFLRWMRLDDAQAALAIGERSHTTGLRLEEAS